MSAVQSLSGHVLLGDKVAQFIYADEAGHEETAPITVVGGVIVDADRKLLLAEEYLEEVLRGIPEEVRQRGKISAKGLWSDPKLRDGWSFASRLNVLRNIIAVPKKCGIPVVYAMTRRGATNWEHPRLTGSELDHISTLANFAAMADRGVREVSQPREVGMLFYEDMGHSRERLNRAVNAYREQTLRFSDHHLNATEEEVARGYRIQDGTLRVERIRKRVVFLTAQEEPLLLLADAVSFTVRRFLNQENFGDDFMNQLVGKAPPVGDFRGPSSAKIHYFD